VITWSAGGQCCRLLLSKALYPRLSGNRLFPAFCARRIFADIRARYINWNRNSVESFPAVLICHFEGRGVYSSDCLSVYCNLDTDLDRQFFRVTVRSVWIWTQLLFWPLAIETHMYIALIMKPPVVFGHIPAGDQSLIPERMNRYSLLCSLHHM
jgi:hypothetical protein